MKILAKAEALLGSKSSDYNKGVQDALNIFRDIPLSDIQVLVEYDYDDEEKHYEENDEPDGHVFQSLKKVGDWLDAQGEKKKQRLEIPFTENDIEELRSGEEFDWCFPTDQGEDIDIRIYQEEYNDEEDEQ